MTQLIRAVIDTNILVSALIFSGGRVAILRQLWQENRFQPLVSKPTVTELIRVLAYPKFKLTPTEREDLLADYLPFCETVQMPIELPQIPPCRDSDDEPFLYLATVGAADYLVTGDRDILVLADVFNCQIVTAEHFLGMF
ncbi:putative toxin-antitoxin system toxin component, PIN family [Chamaesiphon sp. OTE_8_metabat_110]|uniref:putative toxin-antitoxin system toxin component, PIN family n=1 Tax=Chamaesiphon sp. OTE_8_metabat_110 TaxID=2964696 RepID=UPI00286CB05D|nr:putative toxin-antitoxin system toxin component, PIN family [Chamaesiphon sp. OTE_8_metabat_110]